MPLPLGASAPDFDLPGVDGQRYSLARFADKPVLAIVFSCNHCPYVQAYEDRLVAIQGEYAARGVQFVAINSNDDRKYPEDSFEEMVKRARRKGFNFPYVRDATQQVVTVYGAIVTPEVFVFDAARKLRYHGRIDDSRDPKQVRSHDLRMALDALLDGRPVSTPETRPFGCTIKWLG